MTEQLQHPPLHFVQHFSSSPLGARLARLLAVQQMTDWGYPYGCAATRALRQIVAELASNAVTHGHVPGRDFRLRLTLVGRSVWIEVSDARGETWPPPVPHPADPYAGTGRGLLLVSALAARWGVLHRHRAPGKTVWAELRLPAEAPPGRRREPRLFSERRTHDEDGPSRPRTVGR